MQAECAFTRADDLDWFPNGTALVCKSGKNILIFVSYQCYREGV
jgi:hypothetical protein